MGNREILLPQLNLWQTPFTGSVEHSSARESEWGCYCCWWPMIVCVSQSAVSEENNGARG